MCVSTSHYIYENHWVIEEENRSEAMQIEKVKYKLTTKSQEWAIKLVDAWDHGDVSQLFELVNITAANDKTVQVKGTIGILNDSFEPPPIHIVFELSLFKLLAIIDESPQELELYDKSDGSLLAGRRKRHSSQRWRVLLTQELRDAVANDFQVSDYFLTFNTVGTIIYGDAIDSNIASSAMGDVHQDITSEVIADELLNTLGAGFVQSQTALAEAIESLKKSNGEHTKSIAGNIIGQLSNSLQHGAHTAEIIAGIQLISQFLSSL